MPLDRSHSGDEEVRWVNPLTDPAWDQKLASLPGAGIFHSAKWARVLTETYGYTPLYLTIHSGNNLVALLPLLEVASWLTGRRGIALPFTDAVEPLGIDPDAVARLFAAARRIAAGRRWKYLEYRGGRPWLEPALPSTRFFSHVLDLRPGEASVMAGFDDAVRRAVRKAERGGLVAEFSARPEALHEFYALFCQTRRKHGAPPQPFRFFESLRQLVIAPGNGWIILARQGGRAVAGIVCLHFGRTALYKFGGSDESVQLLRGNNLAMAAAIGRYAREGFESFDFGRTSLNNEGLRNFKLGWGASESTIDYWRFDITTESFVAVPDRAGSRQATLFRALPLPVSRWVGRLAYRHIA